MKKGTPRVFLDSNIWFSVIYGSENCKRIVTAHVENQIEAVISKQVLEESIRNITKKIPHKLPSFEKLISSNPPEIVDSPDTSDPSTKGLISLEDQPIFTAAIDAKVDYFVTGNIKDFRIKKLEKLTDIKILTPKQAVEILELK